LYFVADLLQSKCGFGQKMAVFAFLSPPLGSLGATHDDDLRLIGKRAIDFLLV